MRTLQLNCFPRIWCTDSRLTRNIQYRLYATRPTHRHTHNRQYATRPKHRHTRNTYFYDVLGVPSSSSQSQIKNAYIELTKKHHPDVSGSEDSRVKFQLVADAYNVLGNIHSRRMYDRGLVSGARQQSQPEKEEFDPFALPVKPVQTVLDKITMESYRAITEKRILHSRAQARQKKKVEEEKIIYKHKVIKENKEVYGLFILLSIVAFGVFGLEKYWHPSSQQENNKKGYH